jgi:hypothetical protein
MRVNRKATRRIGFAALSFVAAVGVLASAEWIERTLSAEEEYAVYSSYLSDGLLGEWSAGGPVKVAVRNTTSVGENLRVNALCVFDERVHFARMDRLTRVNFLVRNLYPTEILAKFALPRGAIVELTSRSDYFSPEFQKIFPNSQGLVVLSGVGLNRTRTQAVFYIDQFCGLCGGGRYVLMIKIDGAWRVHEQHWTWIS